MGACARPGTGAYGSGWRATACCAGKSQVYWGPIKGLGNGSLCEARDGSLWIGLEGSGLLRWKEPSLLGADKGTGQWEPVRGQGRELMDRVGGQRPAALERAKFTALQPDRKSTRLN